jgi:hypothetical protein
MLQPIGKYLHGDLVPDKLITSVDQINLYIDKFDEETDLTYISKEVTSGYNYYFEQLRNFAELYPNFDYHRSLTEKRTKILSMFYTFVRYENKKFKKYSGY